MEVHVEGLFISPDDLVKSFEQSVSEIQKESFEGILTICGEKIFISLDAANNAVPLNFRKVKEGKISISGSGAVNAFFLSHFQKQPTHLACLRKEPFLFINGHSVSLFGNKNELFCRCTPQQIKHIEKIWKEAVIKSPCFTFAVIEKKDKDGTPIQWSYRKEPLEEVKNFKEFSKEKGIQPKRFYFTDQHAPDSGELGRFEAWVKTLVPKDRIHLFCKRGLGRTTFMSVYAFFLRMEEGFSLNSILDKQVEKGGKDLRVFPGDGHYKNIEAIKRLRLLTELTSPAALQSSALTLKSEVLGTS